MVGWHLFQGFLVEEEKKGEITIIRVGGEIDLLNLPLFESYILRILGGENKKIILDLENLNYGDASFLRKILQIQKELEKAGRSLKILAHPSKIIGKLFALTEINRFLEIFSSEEEAISSFSD